MNISQAGVYATSEGGYGVGPDFTLSDVGSLLILNPLTPDAAAWVTDNLPTDAMHWSGGVVIEPGYAGDILEGIVGDGLRIGRGL